MVNPVNSAPVHVAGLEDVIPYSLDAVIEGVVLPFVHVTVGLVDTAKFRALVVDGSMLSAENEPLVGLLHTACTVADTPTVGTTLPAYAPLTMAITMTIAANTNKLFFITASF